MRPQIARNWPEAAGTRRTLVAVFAVVLLVLAGCSGAMTGSEAPASGDVAPPSGDDAGDRPGERGSVGSFYAADGDRVVVREATMGLRVDEFDRAFRRLRLVAHRYGGYVGDRSRESSGAWAEGTVTLKVPPENFSAARDGVAAVGHLESEDVRVLDFTARAADREARLADLRREEAALEDLLNRTDDVDEARRVREDLDDVREQIRHLEREQAQLSRRAAMSTITVDLHEPVTEKPPRNYRSSFGFGDAFLEAFYGGLAVVKYVIVFFGYVVPIGLAMLPLAAFGLGLVTVWRQSRRLAGRWLRATSPASGDASSGRSPGAGDDGPNDATGGEQSGRDDSTAEEDGDETSDENALFEDDQGDETGE